jgi:co-chaperonin GroES (HSP10)
MGLVIPKRTMELARASNFKDELLKAVGDLSDIEVMHNMALTAVYLRPETTTGGIIRPDENIREDLYQSKVGLVLKLGPNAFVDDATTSFHGQKVNVGDWVAYNVGSSWALTIRDVPCRLVSDSQIKLRLEKPLEIF